MNTFIKTKLISKFISRKEVKSNINITIFEKFDKKIKEENLSLLLLIIEKMNKDIHGCMAILNNLL